jgi:hypothetical protein
MLLMESDVVAAAGPPPGRLQHSVLQQDAHSIRIDN